MAWIHIAEVRHVGTSVAASVGLGAGTGHDIIPSKSRGCSFDDLVIRAGATWNPMAPHDVRIVAFPKASILEGDIVLRISSDEGTLGQLTIGKGGIGWFAFSAASAKNFTWEEFDRLVKETRG